MVLVSCALIGWSLVPASTTYLSVTMFRVPHISSKSANSGNPLISSLPSPVAPLLSLTFLYFLLRFVIIIIIITLFESQIILAEHECCTNWGDCKSNQSNQIKCWFLRRGENRSSRRKTSRSRVENQQTQPTYDAGSGNRTRDTLVEGERSNHYTNPAPQFCHDIALHPSSLQRNSFQCFHCSRVLRFSPTYHLGFFRDLCARIPAGIL